MNNVIRAKATEKLIEHGVIVPGMEMTNCPLNNVHNAVLVVYLKR